MFMGIEFININIEDPGHVGTSVQGLFMNNFLIVPFDLYSYASRFINVH